MVVEYLVQWEEMEKALALDTGMGPFGGICGAEGSKEATWVPDIFPESCRKHDDCYADCTKTKQECDSELTDPYGWALEGPLKKKSKQAYKEAREHCTCKK